MEDIVLDTSFLKFRYYISWFFLIFTGMMWAWITVAFLANIGKTTSTDVKNEKNVLNKSWQKFIFGYGTFMSILFLIVGFVELFIFIFL